MRHPRLVTLAALLAWNAISCQDAHAPEVMLSGHATAGAESDVWIQVGDTARLRADYEQAPTQDMTCHGTQDHTSSLTAPDRFAWSSSRADVAAVTPDGKLIAHAVGSTIVTATASGTGSNPLLAHVVPRLDSARVSVRSLQLAVGDTARVTVQTYDSQGLAVDGLTYELGTSDTTIALAYTPVGAGSPVQVAVVARAPGSTKLIARPVVVPASHAPADTIPVTITARP